MHRRLDHTAAEECTAVDLHRRHSGRRFSLGDTKRAAAKECTVVSTTRPPKNASPVSIYTADAKRAAAQECTVGRFDHTAAEKCTAASIYTDATLGSGLGP